MTSSAARAAHRGQARLLDLLQRAPLWFGGAPGGTNTDLQWANKADEVMALA